MLRYKTKLEDIPSMLYKCSHNLFKLSDLSSAITKTKVYSLKPIYKHKIETVKKMWLLNTTERKIYLDFKNTCTC